MGQTRAFSADRVFTGEEWMPQHSVVVESGMIVDLLPTTSLPAGVIAEKFPGHFIAPAFIDLQIYGAKEKLLAAYPEADSLFKLNEYCNEGGAAFCMPTVATNTREVFFKCIDAVRDYWKQGGEGVLGLHLEGPWLNALKRGAHIESLIHSPALDEVREVLDYGEGVVKIITLAPEVCSVEIVDYILSRGILISAGHSNASYRQAIASFESGIRAVTHLYNAMSPLQHREPGLAGAAMDHAAVMASIIPDGFHVDFAAIRIAKKVMKQRLFVITDAVTQTNVGDYQHQLEGDRYTSNGILSGSALNMIKSVYNLTRFAEVELDEALRMCSLYPAQVMKMDDQLGRIRKGQLARLVAIDEGLQTARLIGS